MKGAIWVIARNSAHISRILCSLNYINSEMDVVNFHNDFQSRKLIAQFILFIQQLWLKSYQVPATKCQGCG